MPADPPEPHDLEPARSSTRVGDDDTTAPAIDFERLAGDRAGGYVSPGARKEKIRQRSYPTPRPGRLPYPELHTASAFSFLDGASQPEDLIQRAAELELPAVALLDRNGVYG
ncbi:MAG: PHP domain-containing protein, partial [Thermoanaerobaculia bacterium]